MAIVKWVFVIPLVVASTILILSNLQTAVHINFLTFRTVAMPLSYCLVIAFLAGLLLALILSIPSQLRLRSRIREIRRKNERLDNEIAELRKLPIGDPIPDRSRIENNTSTLPTKLDDASAKPSS